MDGVFVGASGHGARGDYLEHIVEAFECVAEDIASATSFFHRLRVCVCLSLKRIESASDAHAVLPPTGNHTVATTDMLSCAVRSPSDDSSRELGESVQIRRLLHPSSAGPDLPLAHQPVEHAAQKTRNVAHLRERSDGFEWTICLWLFSLARPNSLSRLGNLDVGFE